MTYPYNTPTAPCATRPGIGVVSFRDAMLPHFPPAYDLGILNCFAGETRIMTWDGPAEIGDLAGTRVRLLTRSVVKSGTARWVEAEIRSFGRQPLMRLVLSRQGVERELFVTTSHRWFVRTGWEYGPNRRSREATAGDLKPGDRLSSVYPQSVATRVNPSSIAIAHGVVFGDGSLTTHDSCVDLFGKKNLELLKYFPEPHVIALPYSVGGLRVTGLPKYFKRFPSLDEGPNYLYGWLAGYFAADGRVTKTGKSELYSADRENLEFVRLVCDRLGIGTYSIRQAKRVGIDGIPSLIYSLGFIGRSLDSNFFVLTSHRERFVHAAKIKTPPDWKVEAVEATDRIEEVFCAVVPGTESFALEDNLLTGNCRPIAGSNKLSEHGKGWAWDVGFRPFCHPRGWWFFNFAVKYRNELGMQYIAWCGQSCRGPNQKDFVHPYGGSSGDHADHVHIAFNAAAAANPNLGRIALALLGQEEDDVTPEEHALLVDAAGQAGFIRNTQIPNIDKEIAAIKQKVNSLSSGGGQVDLDALANKVADKLAERLKS